MGYGLSGIPRDRQTRFNKSILPRLSLGKTVEYRSRSCLSYEFYLMSSGKYCEER